MTARRAGYFVQATSVPGVAQRTGATIYYLEFFPRSDAPAGREPIMALMPNPGDVDIVVASEWMEAGRAINRGLVTRDRTTLIASTHRDYTIGEKMSLGDGRASSRELFEIASASAAKLIGFDMVKVAEGAAGRISAVILGSIAGAGVLPWSIEEYHHAIRESGVGVEASLAAFEAGRRAVVAAAAAPLTAAALARSARNNRLFRLRVWSLVRAVAAKNRKSVSRSAARVARNGSSSPVRLPGRGLRRHVFGSHRAHPRDRHVGVERGAIDCRRGAFPGIVDELRGCNARRAAQDSARPRGTHSTRGKGRP